MGSYVLSACTWVTASRLGILGAFGSKKYKTEAQPKFSESNFRIMSEQDSRLEQYYILAYVFQKIGYRSGLWELSLLVGDSAGENTTEIIFVIDDLEHAQIIFMLQVLKIGSCLKIVIMCLHLELSYVGSYFLPSLSDLHGESNGRESWRKIRTRHLKAKIFPFKDYCVIRKGTYSPAEKGWFTLKTFKNCWLPVFISKGINYKRVWKNDWEEHVEFKVVACCFLCVALCLL